MQSYMKKCRFSSSQAHSEIRHTSRRTYFKRFGQLVELALYKLC